MPADEYYEADSGDEIGGHRGAGHAWMDRDAGPIVRPYAMTGGRARPAAEGFDLVAFVVATGRPGTMQLLPEHRALVARAGEPVSVAELASHVDLLLSDLVADGLISMYSSGPGSQRPDDRVLKAVINGLRSL
jgi:hypothetical protein